MRQNDTQISIALTPRQQAALPHLAAGPTLQAGAKHANVSHATLHRWLRDPRFRDELTRLRNAAAEFAYVELQGILPRAAAVLSEALDNPNPHVRVKAVRVALGIALKAAEFRDLHHRLTMIEDAFNLWKTENAR